MKIPKIPSIKKFKGDNEVSFNKWILQFKARCSRCRGQQKRQVMLRCLEDSAFTLASQGINAENEIM